MNAHNPLIQIIHDNAIALSGRDSDYTALLELIGDARLVLIGDATQGTDEFYHIRAQLSKQLIKYYGFSAIAVQADWLDSEQVNRYILGDCHIKNADNALAEFERFPSWVWHNEAMAEFVDWLRQYNEKKVLPVEKTSFHGLDVYNLNASIETAEELFRIPHNIQVITNAQTYYHDLIQYNVRAWNLREQYMMDTLTFLDAHLSARQNEQAKIIVWGHNSQVGDARATEMASKGKLNLGQLVRDHYNTKETCLIGFSTYQGTVTAASKWGGISRYKNIYPAARGSYEHLFHQAALEDFLLCLRDNKTLTSHLNQSRLQRMIGAVYHSQSEQENHYMLSRLSEQFDAIIHIDTTHALKPSDASR